MKLIKKKRTEDIDLVSSRGIVEKSEDGLILTFRGGDNRKPSYFVLIEKPELMELMGAGKDVLRGEA